MAQWSHADRTLYTKLVYYGPALGGKTTNLQALHRITDPSSTNRLLTLSTADDRTLFFDLLPFELGSILGHRVAMKLYTVPGQVRYDATRRVVLSGADAVVFVADSAASREQENRRSFDNLRLNMKANRLDPSSIPVLVQLNKRDLPDAAPAPVLERALGLPAGRGFEAVAIRGEGVLETFVAACKVMLVRLIAFADARTRREIDPAELARQIDRAFAPHVARIGTAGPSEPAPPDEPIVLSSDDLLESAIRGSMRLGDDLATARARATRLDREVDALRVLGDSLRATGASFDRGAIVAAALAAAGGVLRAACVTLVGRDGRDEPTTEASWKRTTDPLVSIPEGRARLRAVLERPAPFVVEDLAAECGPAPAFAGLRAAAAVPVEDASPRAIVAYAPVPDGRFDDDDVRFLAMVASHLAAGLDKARVHAELTSSRDRLEETVLARTKDLAKALDDLRSLEQTKDRFLANVSHEMRTPVTAIVSAGTFLRDYGGAAEARAEMLETILTSAGSLERLIDGLLRIARLERREDRPRVVETTPREVIEQALRVAGAPGVAVRVDPGLGPISADPERLSRALANLIDNARKFSPPGGAVAVTATPCTLRHAGGAAGAVAFSVLDRGPGVAAADLERVFAPFEQGGEILTSKPRGTGLGLYETRVIARQHGGLVRYAARPGGGSEFLLVVPAVPKGAVDPVRA